MKCKDCGNTHAALPGFPNHVFCDYYHLHMSNIADASRCEHFKPKVTTNADRIRSMTDEELAKWLWFKVGKCPPFDVCPSQCIPCEAKDCWLDWLKEECE